MSTWRSRWFEKGGKRVVLMAMEWGVGKTKQNNMRNSDCMQHDDFVEEVTA